MSVSELQSWLEANRERHLEELKALLRIPSVSARAEHAGDVRRCAEFVAERLRGAGLENVEIHETEGHPIVYGDWLHAGEDRPTLVVYGHYDVQPVEPLELWEHGPFDPVVKEGRIIARGAADDKGQFYCHIKGVEAHLARTGKLPVNVRFLIEGEEEVGSAHLATFLEAQREKLRGDAIIISDTAMISSELPSITCGLRGLVYLQVEVTGPSHDLHSGVFGGSIENPLYALCAMLASLKDAEGRITIPGFYDAVRTLSDEERAAIAAIPFDESAWLRETGAPKLHGEPGFSTLERTGARPTLDLCGIWGGYTGEGSKTVLPSRAYAKVSCRLVPDQDPAVLTELVARHLESIAPDTVTVRVERMHGGAPVLTDVNSPWVQGACRALERAFGRAPVFMREGGSIPIVADFQQILGMDSVMMGFGLNDDRIHSPNEKFELEHYYRGIAASAYLWDELGAD